MKYLSEELFLNEKEVESMLVDLIVLKKLRGSIDKVEGCLILDRKNSSRHSSVSDATLRWIQSLNETNQAYLTTHM